MYEWNDKCFILCSLRYSSSNGSTGEQWTQQPFELCRHNFGSRLRSKRPSLLARVKSTSSDCTSMDGFFDDELDEDGREEPPNDDIELVELLVLGCGWKASTNWKEQIKSFLIISEFRKKHWNWSKLTGVDGVDIFINIISPWFNDRPSIFCDLLEANSFW